MFRRLMSDEFVEELNRLYTSGGWWTMLADSPHVFLAIRDNVLNAYARGMSVAKVVWDGTRIRLIVHEEYLTLASESASPYVELLGGGERSRPVIRTPAEYVARFDLVRSRAGNFSVGERRGANKTACRLSSVIDMEAAFTGGDVDDFEAKNEALSPGRLDLVMCSKDARIIAIEAKLFSNGELRSGKRPKVCSQLEAYHAWLTAHTVELVNAYRRVLDYHRRLNGRFFAGRCAVASAPLTLDAIPRLWIFGHDGYQQTRAKLIADQVAREVSIPGFTRLHVAVVGSPSSLEATHLV